MYWDHPFGAAGRRRAERTDLRGWAWLAELDPAGVDTVVAVGGAGVDLARRDRALVEWLAEAGRTARRVTSVCSGVFLLAAAGLVEGRRVTSHWGRAAQLAAEHPEVI